ncbi:MAG: ABC transporter ATP-binding protein/permease [Lachnospiraceae bacterium]|nr:ABC transporter ATP-binding protein/permease [Lachnospiraceae bacterium]
MANQVKKKERSTLSWVMEFAGIHKIHYILSVIIAFGSVICGFVPYLFLGDMVKGLINHTADETFCMNKIALMALFWVLCRLLHGVSTTLSHKATFSVLAEIRKRLTAKLSRMPLGDVLEQASGTYKNIIIERVDSIETTLAHVIPEVLSNAVVPVGIFIIMLTIDWRLTLLSLLSLPVGMIFFGHMMGTSQKDFDNAIQKTKALNDTAVEYINGIEVIKAFGKSKTSYDKFVHAAKEGADCFIEWMRRCNIDQNCGMALMPAQLLSLLPFSAWFYMKGWISGPDVLMLIILALGLAGPFVRVASYMDDVSKMGVIVGEATSILVKRDLVRPAKSTVSPKGNAIELRDVHFGYKDQEVLHGVNLKINEGEVTALVGPSGAGKSTVAKLIASFWDVDGGEILYGGADIRNMALSEYNKNIAYVSQDNYLFDVSVMENIRMGRPGATDEDVIAAAKACGCHEFILQLEKGYQTIAGGSGAHLSGGERQRIAIARAMLKNAPVVILDEATAYTDPENEAIVQKSVAKLVQGRTLIVIAHRLSTIATADHIILINNGVVEAEGTQEELLQNSALYRKMWNDHIGTIDTEVA